MPCLWVVLQQSEQAETGQDEQGGRSASPMSADRGFLEAMDAQGWLLEAQKTRPDAITGA
jgi:hypothetical protein